MPPNSNPMDMLRLEMGASDHEPLSTLLQRASKNHDLALVKRLMPYATTRDLREFLNGHWDRDSVTHMEMLRVTSQHPRFGLGMALTILDMVGAKYWLADGMPKISADGRLPAQMAVHGISVDLVRRIQAGTLSVADYEDTLRPGWITRFSASLSETAGAEWAFPPEVIAKGESAAQRQAAIQTEHDRQWPSAAKFLEAAHLVGALKVDARWALRDIDGYLRHLKTRVLH